jgi:hypothetical protein
MISPGSKIEIRVDLNKKHIETLLFRIGTDTKCTIADFHHNNHGFSN